MKIGVDVATCLFQRVDQATKHPFIVELSLPDPPSEFLQLFGVLGVLQSPLPEFLQSVRVWSFFTGAPGISLDIGGAAESDRFAALLGVRQPEEFQPGSAFIVFLAVGVGDHYVDSESFDRISPEPAGGLEGPDLCYRLLVLRFQGVVELREKPVRKVGFPRSVSAVKVVERKDAIINPPAQDGS